MLEFCTDGNGPICDTHPRVVRRENRPDKWKLISGNVQRKHRNTVTGGKVQDRRGMQHPSVTSSFIPKCKIKCRELKKHRLAITRSGNIQGS